MLLNNLSINNLNNLILLNNRLIISFSFEGEGEI
jgi:hypothetical protein